MSFQRRIFTKNSLLWMSYGALSFWIPDILIHAVRRYKFDDILLVSIAASLTLVAGYLVAVYFSPRPVTAMNPFLVMAGVWCTGGIGTMIASSFADGGFAGKSGWLFATGLSASTVVFPPMTLMLATYDGTLFALLLITILMIIEATALSARFVQSSAHRISA